MTSKLRLADLLAFLSLSGKLPADPPAGPPPVEATETLVSTAGRYGVEIHLDGPVAH